MESMQPVTKNKIESQKLPPVSLEKATELAAKWEKSAGRFVMAQQMMDEVYKQYPQLDNRKTSNAYEAYQADQKGLAKIAGDAANALSPENLAKALQKPEPEPEPAVTVPVVAEASIPVAEPVEPVESEPTNVVAAPAKKSFVGSLVVQEAAPHAPDSKLAKAQEIAEKIKKHPTKMTAEDWAFKNDPKNATLINNALMEGVTPVVPKEENLIGMGKKSMDRSRSDYTEAVFKNNKDLKKGDVAPWERDHILKNQSEYDENHLNEYQKIYREQGPNAAMQFAIDEKNKKEKDLFKQQNKEDWKNTKEAVGTVVGGTAGLTVAAGLGAVGLAKFGYDRGTKAIQSVNWSKKYEELKKKFAEKKKPLTWNETLKKWVGIEPEEEKKKMELEEKKAELEKLKLGKEKIKDQLKPSAPIDEKVPGAPNAVEKARLEREAVQKKKEFIETVLGGPASTVGVGLGDENLKHWKMMERMPVLKFMEPESATWKGPGGREIKRTVANYPSYGQAMHAKLLPIFKQMEPMGYDFSKMKMDEFLTKAAEKGLLDAPKNA